MIEEFALSVRQLSKEFQTVGGAFTAVNKVSFTIYPGEIVGLVGESGCGKSTLARLITRLLPLTSGEIWVKGLPFHALSGRALIRARKQVQMVFQDPATSLNPRRRVFNIVEEPFLIERSKTAGERAREVGWLLERVGLTPEIGKRLPHELSGGQRQRVGIARALALRPGLLICDEAVSALDVSVRAQIMNLLADLREDLKISYLFISHDLSTVRFLADRVAVMKAGAIVEMGNVDEIFDKPDNNYTKLLLNAYPKIPRNDQSRIEMTSQPWTKQLDVINEAR